MKDLAALKDYILQVYERHRTNHEGQVATYIPELGKANPDHFGISVVTAQGQEFSVGDSQQEFTIQSICKPLAFLMALEQHGAHQRGFPGSGSRCVSQTPEPRRRPGFADRSGGLRLGSRHGLPESCHRLSAAKL